MENGPGLKMYFQLNMVIFHCYVSLPEGNLFMDSWTVFAIRLKQTRVVSACIFFCVQVSNATSFLWSQLTGMMSQAVKWKHAVSLPGGMDPRC